MKTMCPPGYHHNGFVATHALGHMMYVYIYIYYAHLASVRFEHSVCRGSLMTTYIYIYIHTYTYPLHACDYLKKNSIKTNVATDGGSDRNET